MQPGCCVPPEVAEGPLGTALPLLRLLAWRCWGAAVGLPSPPAPSEVRQEGGHGAVGGLGLESIPEKLGHSCFTGRQRRATATERRHSKPCPPRAAERWCGGSAVSYRVLQCPAVPSRAQPCPAVPRRASPAGAALRALIRAAREA